MTEPDRVTDTVVKPGSRPTGSLASADLDKAITPPRLARIIGWLAPLWFRLMLPYS